MIPRFKTMSEKTAIFPGSFDPFTIGHKSIVDRGLGIFSHIIIAVGYNEHKNSFLPADRRVDYIRKIYADNDRVSVVKYTGLTIDFCRRNNVSAILRGIRSISDFEYERDIADINRTLGEIETVFLVSLPEYGAVSSSMIRELIHNGYDPSRFLPLPVRF